MEEQQLHILLFPLMAPGHMIPTLDMAKLFSSCSPPVKSTIVTTPLNSPSFSHSILASKHSPSSINLRILHFPSAAAGMPQGIENLEHCNSQELLSGFIKATTLFEEPLEKLIGELRPDCLVADMLFPWATRVAAKFNIPRLVFHGTSFFALCAGESMSTYKPFKYLTSDSEPFVLPNLPHEIKLTRSQVSQGELEESVNDFTKLMDRVKQADLESYGVIFNTFFELEPDYANHYRNVLKRKAWHIGPFSLHNKEMEEKLVRGKKSTIDEHECLKWLDSRKPNSVIYVSFGSLAKIPGSQLYEIAVALEASDQHFIWVVQEIKNEEESAHKTWLPEGFEERTKGKGLIIRGWAPQVLILDHEAVGGFVTHCGWNSTLEAVCGGVPMVTWPMFVDQFFNEKLVTDVLKIGVSVGVTSAGIKREEVESAVRKIMEGEEGEEMRRRAKELKEKAKMAVEKDGSSYKDLIALIQELHVFS